MIEKTYITKPFLPPIEEYTRMLDQIWASKVLTNEGNFCRIFEKKLCEYLKVENICLVNSGTSGLMIALKSLNLKGEIITTPFSFIATAQVISWNGLVPVFVDVEKEAGNLDPAKVENAINEKTCGILATHNYGLPSENTLIQEIASKNNLPLIYDSAPAFGVTSRGETILNLGNMSVVSFHATQVMTTFEGGAIICSSREQKERIDQIKNFSFVGNSKVNGLGMNGKLNEPAAAMGILQLKYLNKNINKRKSIFNKYLNGLSGIKKIKCISLSKHLEYNYAYCPVFFLEGFKRRELVFSILESKNIFCRRYWFPLITENQVYSSSKKGKLKNAKEMSESVLCLPIFYELSYEVVDQIILIITESLKIKIN